MKIVSKQYVENMGLHDSLLLEFNLNFHEKTILIRLKLFNNSFLEIYFSGVKKVSGIGFDNINNVIVLDHIITDNEFKIFTTLSECIRIIFDEIEAHIDK